MARSVGYLLDTNILVHLIRNNTAGVAVASNYGLDAGLSHCVISVVTVGEMLALVRKFAWGMTKSTQLQKVLEQVVWVDINNPAILDAYAELDDSSQRAGSKMGKNDLWIAATAKVTGVTLLTCDGDFDHLHPAQISRIRLDQQTGKVSP